MAKVFPSKMKSDEKMQQGYYLELEERGRTDEEKIQRNKLYARNVHHELAKCP